MEFCTTQVFNMPQYKLSMAIANALHFVYVVSYEGYTTTPLGYGNSFNARIVRVWVS
jgi:hypothetical protein